MTVRPVRTAPFASRVVAVACEVSTAVIDVGASATVTAVTGARETVIEDVAVLPSLAAVIDTLPAPVAVTNPFASTAATAGLLELHAIARPERTFPLASFVIAESCCVGSIPKMRFAVAGLTVTVATGDGVTVSRAAPVFPSLVAMILAVPAFTAVTSPVVGLTVATAVLSELHAIVRAVSTRPWESTNVAVASVVWIPVMAAAASDTVTAATGAGVTVSAALPLCPSLTAVMPAVPTATAVTMPCASTVATAVFPDVHVIDRPVRTAPLTSRVVAVA
jgi:hypothetical protein